MWVFSTHQQAVDGIKVTVIMQVITLHEKQVIAEYEENQYPKDSRDRNSHYNNGDHIRKSECDYDDEYDDGKYDNDDDIINNTNNT